MSKTKKKKKHRLFWHFFRIQLVLLVLVLTAAAYYFYGGYGKQVEELKQEAVRLVRQSDVDTFKANQTSIVYASDGSVISTLKGEKDSYYVSIEEMPVDAVTAIVSIEDKKFFRHHGIDYRALLRAVKAMVQNGEVKQGGSTITMQLARNIFLSQEKTWQRKVEEMYIATELENKYSKDQILEFYLNNIYFGNGYYGIQSAARGYFDRDVESLSLSQIAFLCAIPNNPTLYDPVTNKDNTVSRRDRILKNMLDDGKISQMDYAQAVAEQMSEAKPISAQEEIEAANTVFEKYGFAFYDLAASSPKSDKTRRSCAAAVGTLLHSPVLFASMQSAHSLPIKALAQQCGVSARTITRHRDYIVAAALLIDGDYPILCTYLQTMRKEAEQCVR